MFETGNDFDRRRPIRKHNNQRKSSAMRYRHRIKIDDKVRGNRFWILQSFANNFATPFEKDLSCGNIRCPFIKIFHRFHPRCFDLRITNTFVFCIAYDHPIDWNVYEKTDWKRKLYSKYSKYSKRSFENRIFSKLSWLSWKKMKKMKKKRVKLCKFMKKVYAFWKCFPLVNDLWMKWFNARTYHMPSDA